MYLIVPVSVCVDRVLSFDLGALGYSSYCDVDVTFESWFFFYYSSVIAVSKILYLISVFSTDVKEKIAGEAGVNLDAIRGSRAPQLTPGGDDQLIGK